ncbi:MAG: hypothetical protein QF718_06735 [Phycisphaerales bacterium]|nr:hypothetical protein [Phycisphaerales bacterium]
MNNQFSSISNMQCCPFIEDGHEACSSKFTLGRLDQACSVCFGSFKSCSMYVQLSGICNTTTLDMTVDSHVVELRPTGS